MADHPDVVVVGAGVIGLTTAIRLLESGLSVRVWADRLPPDTTSILATAMIGPSFMPPGDAASAWEAETVKELTGGGRLAQGAHMCRGRFMARAANVMPPAVEQLSGFALCTADELPAGFETGFWLEVPLVDMPVYMAHLTDRLAALGGSIEARAVASLSEAFAVTDRVANCSGLGARDLAPDPSVVPLRGPKLVVENPGLDTFFIEAPLGPVFTSWHPHGDKVVIGGSMRESEDTTPDPDEAAAMLERASAIEPRLRGVRILEHRVGLRPLRPAVRLEVEPIGGATVVHNYGHGPLGVTLAWGCARDAVALLTM